MQKLFAKVVHEGIPSDMVWIEPGSFVKGSPEGEQARYRDEIQHEVVLSRGFWMGNYPVTQEEWEGVMRYNPSQFKGARRPVERVNWYEALAYCNALSKREGLPAYYKLSGVKKRTKTLGFRVKSVSLVEGSNGYRLPTEAEWEYACRAGTRTARYGVEDEIGWNLDNSDAGRTHDVGLKAPNAWGLYDTLGNVWEWCWGWYEAYDQLKVFPYAGGATDPVGPESGTWRIFRGSSWASDGDFMRAANRGRNTPDFTDNFLGFRCVRFA